MIILRQKSFSTKGGGVAEQKEFNSDAAKERNYKWLRKTANDPVKGAGAIIKHIEDRTAIARDKLRSDADFKAWNKLDLKEKLKRELELRSFLRDNERAKKLEEKTKERIKRASDGHRKYIDNLYEKAEKLDMIADTKNNPGETKEYEKAGKLLKKARKTGESGERLAMEKANLRGTKAERDFLEDRIGKAKRLAERENKLSIIRENNKFSNKLKRGIKNFFKKKVK